MLSSALVCLLAGLYKTTLLIFTEVNGKVAHGPWKKPMDFSNSSNIST